MLNQVLETFGAVTDNDYSIMKDKQILFDITDSILEKSRNVLLSSARAILDSLNRFRMSWVALEPTWYRCWIVENVHLFWRMLITPRIVL